MGSGVAYQIWMASIQQHRLLGWTGEPGDGGAVEGTRNPSFLYLVTKGFKPTGTLILQTLLEK